MNFANVDFIPYYFAARLHAALGLIIKFTFQIISKIGGHLLPELAPIWGALTCYDEVGRIINI